MAEKFDVVVIGGGTAGLVTASGCARLGRRVALIERHEFGGDCLWTGCVPTKALIASARLASSMRHADAFGLTPSDPTISPRAVMQSMRERRRTAGRHDDPERFRKLGIDVIKGEATLLARDSVRVGQRELLAKDVVIATGSRTAVPPVDGLTGSGFVDHASFLAGDTFPASVLILGGGAIGVEFAQVLRRFGSRVTLVEMLDTILPREDHDVIASIDALLRAEGIDVRVRWRATRVTAEGGRKLVTIENGAGMSETITVDEVFVASGRRGNVEGLGLDTAGVRCDRSWITVDKYLQTTTPRIWACGDVHGARQFTHVAAYEAVKVVRNMLFPGKSAVQYDNIPSAIYTDPEAARVGMTQAEARAAIGEDELRIYRTEMADVDRAVVDGTPFGFVKLVCDRKGRLLGAHAICPHASTLIAEIVAARSRRMRAGDLAQLVSAYPSLADAVQKTAAQHYQGVASSWVGGLARIIAAWSQ